MSSAVSIDVSRKDFMVNGRTLPVIGTLRLELTPGEFAVLLGPSGCGKTTLLRIILGLDSDFDGQVRIGNALVTGPGLDRGAVFQEPRLIPWKSVRQNIQFALPTRDDKPHRQSDELIALTGLQGFEDAWPNQLSGGMAQRVALARALINIPDLLLLDEPFGALDSFTKMAMQEELLRVFEKEGTTTLMITHDIDEAIFLADRVIVLSPRPAHIRTQIRIPLSRPRDRASSGFLELHRELLGFLHA